MSTRQILLPATLRVIENPLEIIPCSIISSQESLKNYHVDIYYILYYSLELLSGFLFELSLIQNRNKEESDLEEETILGEELILGEEPIYGEDILSATEKYLL